MTQWVLASLRDNTPTPPPIPPPPPPAVFFGATVGRFYLEGELLGAQLCVLDLSGPPKVLADLALGVQSWIHQEGKSAGFVLFFLLGLGVGVWGGGMFLGFLCFPFSWVWFSLVLLVCVRVCAP